MDVYSEELVTMWHLVQDWARQGGWPILDACDTRSGFNDFCHFCFARSSGYPPAA